MVSRLGIVTTIPSPAAGMRELGAYLREQRLAAKLSVRQLSAVTGISNPYLSQIERGLRRPSADILQQLAQGLSLSAESLYIRAGLLDPDHAPHEADARVAIRNDPRLDGPQRQALLDAYRRIVEDGRYAAVDVPPSSSAAACGHQGTTPSHHHGSKEMCMNAKPGTSGIESDQQIEKSPLTPIYAMVGASDLAVEKLVELGQKAAKDAEQGIDDLQQRADDLQQKANRDVSKAIEGAKQLPQEAVRQARKAVAKGRRQYVDLARRGMDVDLTGQASSTAAGLMKQAGELAGRSRKEAGQAVDKRIHRAAHLVEQGRHEAETRVAKGRHQAENVVEQGRQEAEKRVAEGRRVAERTRRTAVSQADKVMGQATHVVEAVSHAGRYPLEAAKTVTAEVRRPIARRRRSPGFASPESRPVMTPGVDAAATTPTAKAPAAKAATAKKAATKKAATKPAVKRASATPTTAGVPKRITKRAVKPVTVTPADMPETPAVIPVLPEPAMPDTPGDKLPVSSGE